MEHLSLKDRRRRQSIAFAPKSDSQDPYVSRLPTPEESGSSHKSSDDERRSKVTRRHSPDRVYIRRPVEHGGFQGRMLSPSSNARRIPDSPPYHPSDSQKPSLPPLKTVSVCLWPFNKRQWETDTCKDSCKQLDKSAPKSYVSRFISATSPSRTSIHLCDVQAAVFIPSEEAAHGVSPRARPSVLSTRNQLPSIVRVRRVQSTESSSANKRARSISTVAPTINSAFAS